MLREDGLRGVESTVLWGGRRFADHAVVLAVLYPSGGDVERTHEFVRVGADATAEMGRWLRAQELTGLAQVHTHPSAWTGHSQTDDDFPIASSHGFLSLVWPNFAQQAIRNVGDLGVHRLLNGRWHHLTERESHALIEIVESEAIVSASHEDRSADRNTTSARVTGARGVVDE
jgi:hypothetical protein